jgi:hypothetical protein
VHQLQQLLDAGTLLACRHAVQLREVLEVVERRQAFVQTAIAPEDVPHVPPDLLGVGHHVVPEDPRRAPGWEQQRDEHLDGRGLAGPVGSQQAEELAALDLEVDALDRLDLAGGPPPDPGPRTVAAAEVLDLDDRHRHVLPGVGFGRLAIRTDEVRPDSRPEVR